MIINAVRQGFLVHGVICILDPWEYLLSWIIKKNGFLKWCLHFKNKNKKVISLTCKLGWSPKRLYIHLKSISHDKQDIMSSQEPLSIKRAYTQAHSGNYTGATEL